MWAILITALRYGATALAGWAISDIYNEYNTTQQATSTNPTATKPKIWSVITSSFKDNWLKWIIGAAIITVLTLTILKIFKRKK